jgi:gliding motility-associated lipoprotein GldD
MLRNIRFFFCGFSIFFFLSCTSVLTDEDEVSTSPRPRGYIRIKFPNKEYTRWYDSSCPFSFEIPVYAYMAVKDSVNCWWNLNFPRFRATLHISYKFLQKDSLSKVIEDCRTLAIRHQIKAMGLEEIPVIRDSSRVYGLIYQIKGNTASNLQFYITDSVTHFLRGSLYFNVYPNYDSIQPVLEFIQQDVVRLIKSTHWKN